MTVKEHVFESSIQEDSAYIGLGSWGDFPGIVYAETLAVTSLGQKGPDGQLQTIRFTDRQLEVLYKMLKRRYEE
jgi:hypothetical protein